MTHSHGLYDKTVWPWVNCGGDTKKTSNIQTEFQIYSGVQHKWQQQHEGMSWNGWYWIRLTPVSAAWACRVENMDSNLVCAGVHLYMFSWLVVWESNSPHTGLWTFERRQQPEQKMLVWSRAQLLENTWRNYRARKREREQEMKRSREKRYGSKETEKEIMRMLHWQRHIQQK